MVRTMRFSAAVVAAMLLIHCGRSMAGTPTTVGATSDSTQIYTAFLSNWTGDTRSPLNLSQSADLPKADDIEQYTQCAKANGAKHVRWSTSTSTADLRATLRTLQNIRFVDPAAWQPMDPGALISKGEAVDAAVKDGFAHGLMSLSVISFNELHDTAMFSYSFRCGSMCGNGGTVMFKKTLTGWKQVKADCGSWMS